MSPARWQLPQGVDQALWDYLHDPAIARSYDAGLADCGLLKVDQAFVDRHFRRPGRVLDLGCGTGRLLIHLARRGFWTVGVDLSEEMLRLAGEKAAAEGLVVGRLKANLVDLGSLDDQSFDYAACLFSTLGMVRGREQRGKVLGHVYRLLRPGGIFVLHVHNRWFNGWLQATRGWLIQDCFRTLFRSAAAGDCRMPAHQGIGGLTLHLFTRGEIVQLVRRAGFRILELAPVSLRPDGKVRWPGWFGRLRAYGYLLALGR
jgi:ubiquinone/menaquinone biosynthesis C-methylase UbiE